MENLKTKSKYVCAVVKLAQPDENGRSRVFYPREFVGEYDLLGHNNGCSWARQVRKFFKLKIEHEGGTPQGDVVSYQLKGLQEQWQFNDAVAGWIRKYFASLKGKRSAWSGIPCDKEYELDHNKGVKTDRRVGNPDTQLISDFQVLTPSENKCKREICLKCKQTARRPKGSEIFVGQTVDYTKGSEKLRWDRELQDWATDACDGCCLNDCVKWRRDAERIVVNRANEPGFDLVKYNAERGQEDHDREVILRHEEQKAKLKWGGV